MLFIVHRLDREGVALILDIDMTVKPRAQPSAAGGVLGRSQAPIGH
jgi:hypothetical protein